MKRIPLITLAFLTMANLVFAESKQTIRVDFYHSGNALTELFSLHQVVIEPLPWPGNPNQPVDKTNLGFYFFEVVDPVTNDVFFSRGFSSIFGEWQTTGEAQRMNRTFHESVRFPHPGQTVRLRISKRDDRNAFTTAWTAEIDPADMLVVRKHAPLAGKLRTLLDSGDPAQKVDLLFLAEGYTEAESALFLQHVKNGMQALFSVSPFRERKTDFNVHALHPAAAESGANRPSNGTFRYSPSGTTYDAFRAERYVLAFNNLGYRELIQHVPYDFVVILLNSETYGGGGIYQLYSTVAEKGGAGPVLLVHEFGHSFAALADEYYTSASVYGESRMQPEPWERNATALQDPSKLKWRDLVDKKTPLPTSWPKIEFETFQRSNQARRAQLRKENRPEAEMNALFRNEQQFVDSLFNAAKIAPDAIGAFEGGYYKAQGIYRPAMNCLMFTRDMEFCKVCSRGVTEVIDLYTR